MKNYPTCKGIKDIHPCIYCLHYSLQAKNLKQMPLVLFGVLTLIGAILCIALPETHNKPLPDTKEDVENKKKVVMKQEPDLPGAREDVFIHS